MSRFESEPSGASIFLEGAFVGRTPAAIYLPDETQVEVRLELPGFAPERDVLRRLPGLSPEAPPGHGWEEVYFYPLRLKGRAERDR